ncbi:MAG: phosphoglycerate kinase [Gammaproteobacteria bacterium]|jgi:phosphoglycerate kinase|nr:phosphoglycerate kinase [Gammaproteobacteria bacterium]MBT5154673.1 phosphoglycerate kinase [Gammaproteobacteria bacterium]MBT5684847.1 phosphoglycerate kinase [Gammaproteobacteria bacterium]MBT5725034.1 phosphoglycerate kinase [Gammaproteobacteria bacterium]MBT6586952.1 phosphoglycerate kinase [Gammaproteobacteria bacterium]
MAILRFGNLDIRDKRVLIREDLNVPVDNGQVTSDARIRAALPTLEYAVKQGAKVMVMSHLGRPQEGLSIDQQQELSLEPVASRISELSGLTVRLETSYLEGVSFGDEDILLFENIRINVGEKSNDESLSKKLALLADIFVMDAFGTAHRAQASTEGVARLAPVACAGPLLSAELSALGKALADPVRPMTAIVGGSKVSTKLEVLNSLVEKVDSLVVGGGIANTFLAATGINVGKSLCEAGLSDTAKQLLDRVHIPLPTDVVVAKALSADATAVIKSVHQVKADEMILDIGPDSRAAICEMMAQAGTILWNGPVGVFEIPQFAEGTKALALSIAESQAFSVAGGGDTLAAIEQFGLSDKISYISTGGGAFLEFVEGKTLPAVAALEARGE